MEVYLALLSFFFVLPGAFLGDDLELNFLECDGSTHSCPVVNNLTAVLTGTLALGDATRLNLAIEADEELSGDELPVTLVCICSSGAEKSCLNFTCDPDSGIRVFKVRLEAGRITLPTIKDHSMKVLTTVLADDIPIPLQSFTLLLRDNRCKCAHTRHTPKCIPPNT